MECVDSYLPICKLYERELMSQMSEWPSTIAMAGWV